jgi:co-chaperonin GroES (HSP10)
VHRVKPLRDLVCVKLIEYKHSFLFVAGIQLRKGYVVAVGPGRRMRRKIAYRRNPERSDEVTWFEDGQETGKIRPKRVAVGDVVEFGWRTGTEFILDGEKLLMIPEQSIYGLTTADADVGLLEPRSMAVPV